MLLPEALDTARFLDPHRQREPLPIWSSYARETSLLADSSR